MNAPKAPQRPVPTLTEVIDLPRARAGRAGNGAGAEVPGGFEESGALPVPDVWESGTPALRPQPASTPAAGGAAVDADELAERIVRNLQTQVDVLFEGRLQQALAPVLARIADGLIRELRTEVDAGVRDLVQQAVANEIARLSKR